MKKQSGFTLIELMIVVAIIAIIAAIAIPNLLSARLNANETSAISTMRNISSAQAQFQASSKADEDNDGTGEFGFFGELSGGVAVRGTSAALNPPVLSGAFRTLSSVTPGVSRSGYFFTIHMAANGAGGASISENATTGGVAAGALDADLCETTWTCYAWPVNYGNSGNRTFFVNQTGDITSTDDSDYQGAQWLHAYGWSSAAAFQATATIHQITGQVAVGTVGHDGNMWRQVN